MGFIGPVGEAGLAGEKVNSLFILCELIDLTNPRAT